MENEELFAKVVKSWILQERITLCRIQKGKK